MAKRECNAHYCWEKLRRAELDMDRVRQWLKIDELFEQERQVQPKNIMRYFSIISFNFPFFLATRRRILFLGVPECSA